MGINSGYSYMLLLTWFINYYHHYPCGQEFSPYVQTIVVLVFYLQEEEGGRGGNNFNEVLWLR